MALVAPATGLVPWYVHAPREEDTVCYDTLSINIMAAASCASGYNITPGAQFKPDGLACHVRLHGSASSIGLPLVSTYWARRIMHGISRSAVYYKLLIYYTVQYTVLYVHAQRSYVLCNIYVPSYITLQIER